MALEASHIRFALDLRDSLGVSNIDAYVSGAIYPDSQYVTGAGKSATHPKEYRTDKVFMSTDFHKGWYVHLLCDTIQQALMKNELPETSEGTDQESWEKRTAIKMLQDIEDARAFDLGKYLPSLYHVENPNGEDREKMRQYNGILRAMYSDISKLDISTEADMWIKFGIGEALAEKISEAARSYAKDENVMAKVRGLYCMMLDKARVELRS